MTPLPTASSLDQFTDPWLDTTAELERCARFLDLEDWIVMRLRQCEQETTVEAVFSTAAGPRPVSATLIRHSSTLGSPLTAVRVRGDINLVDDRIRAMRQTWASALFGLPHGGSSLAVGLDTEAHGEAVLRAALSSVGRQLADPIGESVLYPENAASEELEWLRSAIHGATPTTRFTGACVSTDVSTAIGTGMLQLVHYSASRIAGLRVAVQGFDSVTRRLVSLLHGHGARIVAVADESGGVYDEMGLDPAALANHHGEAGMLLGFPAGEARLNHEVLELDCDVLILAGGAHQITVSNVGSLHAKSVLEATPDAISATAKAVLSDKGILIVPDLLCAGVRSLFYSMAPECSATGAPTMALMRRAVRSRLKEVDLAAQRWNVPVHRAALLVGIRRVADVLRIQGM